MPPTTASPWRPYGRPRDGGPLRAALVVGFREAGVGFEHKLEPSANIAVAGCGRLRRPPTQPATSGVRNRTQ